MRGFRQSNIEPSQPLYLNFFSPSEGLYYNMKDCINNLPSLPTFPMFTPRKIEKVREFRGKDHLRQVGLTPWSSHYLSTTLWFTRPIALKSG